MEVGVCVIYLRCNESVKPLYGLIVSYDAIHSVHVDHDLA